MDKSSTDIHWNDRALAESDDARVNIADTVQRDLELQFIFAQVPADGAVLEVGCGNGYVTRQLRERVRRIDAFDYAENMVDRARRAYGEINNRFFHASILDAAACEAGAYDAAICVRVLINLRNAAEQATALDNLARWLKPGGKLILVEGFTDGFEALNQLRRDCELPELVPAAINFYSSLAELMPTIERSFTIADEFHTGMFDFLTRVVYPRLVGPDQVGGSADFHHKIDIIARQYNPAAMRPLARVRGFALVKRSS
jgi:ubiquinone/menaquinone biosynthesis C-methylase UbiE